METKRKRGRRSSGVELSRFSVSLPLRLLQVFESVIKEQGYATISEAIRDLMRLHVERALAREKEGQELGIVAYILPANANERKLTLINEMMECEAEFRDCYFLCLFFFLHSFFTSSSPSWTINLKS